VVYSNGRQTSALGLERQRDKIKYEKTGRKAKVRDRLMVFLYIEKNKGKSKGPRGKWGMSFSDVGGDLPQPFKRLYQRRGTLGGEGRYLHWVLSRRAAEEASETWGFEDIGGGLCGLNFISAART